MLLLCPFGLEQGKDKNCLSNLSKVDHLFLKWAMKDFTGLCKIIFLILYLKNFHCYNE